MGLDKNVTNRFFRIAIQIMVTDYGLDYGDYGDRITDYGGLR